MGMLTLRPGDTDPDRAVERARRLLADGADIIDIRAPEGGDRSPSTEVGCDVIGGVVRALVEVGAVVNVTSTDADIGIVAAENGARYLNDVSGGRNDPFMARIVAASGLTFIAGYSAPRINRRARHASTPKSSGVADQLSQRADALLDAGIDSRRLILDVGPGHARDSDSEEDWRLLDQFDRLTGLGFPILITPSDSKFLDSLLPDDATSDERDAAALAVTVLASGASMWGVRVRNVARTCRGLRHPTPQEVALSSGSDAPAIPIPLVKGHHG